MSTNQIVITVLIASIFLTATALVGIILNRNDASTLRTEMSQVRERLARLEAKA